MRIVSKSRKHFHGTHKGYEVHIEREKCSDDVDVWGGAFYIKVRSLESGLHAYDGYSPAGVRTMKEAKREALQGAQL